MTRFVLIMTFFIMCWPGLYGFFDHTLKRAEAFLPCTLTRASTCDGEVVFKLLQVEDLDYSSLTFYENGVKSWQFSKIMSNIILQVM